MSLFAERNTWRMTHEQYLARERNLRAMPSSFAVVVLSQQNEILGKPRVRVKAPGFRYGENWQVMVPSNTKISVQVTE